jgi:hypothetical protein
MNFSHVSGSLVVVFCLGITTFAQSSPTGVKPLDETRQVVVENDRFSGNVTVKIKPQTLIDQSDRKLTMGLKYHLDKKKLEESSFITEEIASLTFETFVKGSVAYGDREVHFIVDGVPLKIGRTSARSDEPLLSKSDQSGRMPDFTFLSALTLSQVETIAAGKKVEMRLGAIEAMLDPSTLSAIKEFGREFANHAPTRLNSKSKGAKP